MKVMLFAATVLVSSLSFAQESDQSQRPHRGPRREMPAEVREAFTSCRTELGLTRTPGERRSKEDHQKMKACFKSKGVKPPQKPNHKPKPQES